MKSEKRAVRVFERSRCLVLEGVYSNTPSQTYKGQFMKNDFDTLKFVSGIDTLYYFCESSLEYDDLFLDILDQMECIKGKFEKKEIDYTNADITISINHITLSSLGKSEGYYWFKDINEFFKIGFKDKNTNQGLHDIRVQLLGNGIYTIGIKSIIEFIDTMLEGYITKEHPITRIDLNMFIQYDLGFVDKRMFVTKKRNYASISEIGDANSIQTLYVGKPPFKLRIYNKSLELKQSKKQEVMEAYFRLNGFDIQQAIFNVEFEMHRSHLRAFNIITIEEALHNTQMLFKHAMEDIRLIDINTLSVKDSENHTKNRAKTLPIWEFIKENYSIEDFLQVTSPLERIKRKAYVYDETSFTKEHKLLIRKGLINSVPITKELLIQNLDETVQELHEPTNPTPKPFYAPKDFIPIEIKQFDGTKQHFRLLRNGRLIKPVNVLSVSKLSDFELLHYLDDITEDFNKEDIDFTTANKRYKVAYDEAVRRKLKPEIPF